MRARFYAAGLALILVLGSCSGSDPAPTAAPESTTTAASTSVAPAAGPTTIPPTTAPVATTTPATTIASSTTPVAPLAAFAVGTPTLIPPPPLDGSDGARGSGCAPGTSALPDGIWFGIASPQATHLDFDLACFFFGDTAWTRAAEVGEEAYNDVFIGNVNPTLRAVPASHDVTVHWIDGVDLGFRSSIYDDWRVDERGYGDCPGEGCVVWLYVNDGELTEVVEQYLP